MIRVSWRSLSFRLIAAAVVGLGLGLVAAGTMLVKVYERSVTSAFEVRLNALARIVVANAEVDAAGHLFLPDNIGDPLFETTYSGWYWQVSSAAAPGRPAAVLARSPSLFDQALNVPADESASKGFTPGPRGQRLRVVRLRVTLPSGPYPYDILVAGDYENVESQVRSYVGTLLAALGLFFVGAILALILQVRFAMSPMRRIRDALTAVRHGTANVLQGRFPPEVEPLVTELNALLAHNRELLERARTQVGNLAHALKTPLSVLRNEVEQGNDAELRKVVRRETDRMRRQVDHYLKRARAAASANVLGARTVLLPRAQALVRTMRKIHQDRDIEFDLDCPAELSFRGEAQDLDEILGNLLDNGGKWASSRVTMSVKAAGDKIEIVVDDDGPGLSELERQAVFQRGQRLDETVPGSGLGLSIVRDLAGLYGGTFNLDRSPLGGLRAILRLPAVKRV